MFPALLDDLPSKPLVGCTLAVPLLFLSRRTRDTRHALTALASASASARGTHLEAALGTCLQHASAVGSESLSDLLIIVLVSIQTLTRQPSSRNYSRATVTYSVNLVAAPDWLAPVSRRTDPLPRGETKGALLPTQRDNLRRLGRSKGNEKQQSAEQVEMLRGSSTKNDVEALSQSVFFVVKENSSGRSKSIALTHRLSML
jgi:hypothetical protein